MTGQEAPLSGLDIDPIADPDVDAVVALWRACGLTRPWKDPYADIALARRTASATVLVGRADGEITATAMAGSDGPRGWVYYAWRPRLTPEDAATGAPSCARRRPS